MAGYAHRVTIMQIGKQHKKLRDAESRLAKTRKEVEQQLAVLLAQLPEEKREQYAHPTQPSRRPNP